MAMLGQVFTHIRTNIARSADHQNISLRNHAAPEPRTTSDMVFIGILKSSKSDHFYDDHSAGWDVSSAGKTVELLTEYS
jgi:hypothetical protein